MSYLNTESSGEDSYDVKFSNSEDLICTVTFHTSEGPITHTQKRAAVIRLQKAIERALLDNWKRENFET